MQDLKEKKNIKKNKLGKKKKKTKVSSLKKKCILALQNATLETRIDSGWEREREREGERERERVLKQVWQWSESIFVLERMLSHFKTKKTQTKNSIERHEENIVKTRLKEKRKWKWKNKIMKKKKKKKNSPRTKL